MPYWFSDSWMDRILDSYLYDFDKALNRWRSLYKLAQQQIEEAQTVTRNNIYGENSKEKKEALLKERRGIELRDMLLGQNQGKNAEENEFYPYRYFASEGFLPGYNFTKLPEYKEKEILAMEKEMMGIYISGHPLDKLREEIEKATTINSLQMLQIKVRHMMDTIRSQFNYTSVL